MTERADEAEPGLFGRQLLYAAVLALPLITSTVVSPLLTRRLGVDGFGWVAGAGSLNQLVVALVLLGLDQAVVVQRGEDGHSRTARGVVALGLVLIGGLVGALALLSPLWAPAMGFAGPQAPGVLAVTLVWSAVGAGCLLVGSLLMAERRLSAFTAVAVLATVGGQGLGLAAVLAGEPRAASYLTGLAGATTVALVVGVMATRPRWAGIADRVAARRALQLGLPLAAGSFATYVLNAGDRLLIQRLQGPGEAGRYQVAYTVGYVVVLLVQYVGQSWAPRIAEERDAARRLVLHTGSREGLLRMLAPAVLGVCLAAPVLLRVFAPASFRPGELTLVVALVAVAAFPVATAGVAHRELLAERRGRPVAVATGVAAALNLVLNLMVIPIWGIVGAAFSTLVAFGVQRLVLVAAVRAHESWPGGSWRLQGLVGTASAAAVGSSLLTDTAVSRWVRFALAVLVCGPWLLTELRRARR